MKAAEENGQTESRGGKGKGRSCIIEAEPTHVVYMHCLVNITARVNFQLGPLNWYQTKQAKTESHISLGY